MSALELSAVEVTYTEGRKRVMAVRGVTLTVGHGETVAIVGESGCGKSSTARVAAGLQEPTVGSVGWSVEGSEALEPVDNRDGRIQFVFQHPDQSLDPLWTVEKSIGEPLRRTQLSAGDRRERIVATMKKVGLREAFLKRRPDELSGGQAQRVAVARALISEPRVIVLDEPTASLDQSIRSRLLGTLQQLQKETGVGYLMVTHDIATVRRLAHRIVVMYLGKIVEEGTAEQVLTSPLHPYTRALLADVPPADPGTEWRPVLLPGETPSPTEDPTGCAFASRCPIAIAECRLASPPLDSRGENHKVACIRVSESGAQKTEPLVPA